MNWQVIMTSGSIVVMELEKENAVDDWLRLIGATDPSKADSNTLCHLYGSSVGCNATHGSESFDNSFIFTPIHLTAL